MPARISRRALLTIAAAGTLPAACARRGDNGVTGPEKSSAPSSPPTVAPSARPSLVVPPSASGQTGKSRLGGPVPYEPGKALLGSYLGLKGLSMPAALALRRRQLGRDQRILHFFYNFEDTLLKGAPALSPATIPLISWGGARYAEILGGRSDKLIAAAAKKLAAYRRPVMLRWGWEMNGNWFAWDGAHNGHKASGYIASWQRLRKIFTAEGASNVAWVWSPNWNSAPDVPWNNYERYYPGDAYVDWVGLSAYPFGSQAPRTLFQRICRVYGGRKPILLAETAGIDHGGTSKADWIKSLTAYVDAMPAIGGVVWFDTDIQPGTKENFRIDSNAATLAAYKAMAVSPRFSG